MLLLHLNQNKTFLWKLKLFIDFFNILLNKYYNYKKDKIYKKCLQIRINKFYLKNKF